MSDQRSERESVETRRTLEASSKFPGAVLADVEDALVVAFSPQHRSAMPNRVGAMALPSSGESNACA